MFSGCIKWEIDQKMRKLKQINRFYPLKTLKDMQFEME